MSDDAPLLLSVFDLTFVKTCIVLLYITGA